MMVPTVALVLVGLVLVTQLFAWYYTRRSLHEAQVALFEAEWNLAEARRHTLDQRRFQGVTDEQAAALREKYELDARQWLALQDLADQQAETRNARRNRAMSRPRGTAGGYEEDA